MKSNSCDVLFNGRQSIGPAVIDVLVSDAYSGQAWLSHSSKNLVL